MSHSEAQPIAATGSRFHAGHEATNHCKVYKKEDSWKEMIKKNNNVTIIGCFS